MRLFFNFIQKDEEYGLIYYSFSKDWFGIRVEFLPIFHINKSTSYNFTSLLSIIDTLLENIQNRNNNKIIMVIFS